LGLFGSFRIPSFAILGQSSGKDVGIWGVQTEGVQGKEFASISYEVKKNSCIFYWLSISFDLGFTHFYCVTSYSFLGHVHFKEAATDDYFCKPFPGPVPPNSRRF
jgi:hypothetical protein